MNRRYRIEAEPQDLIIVGGNDEKENITLALIPVKEDQELLKKALISVMSYRIFQK